MANIIPFFASKLKVERAHQHIQEVERWCHDLVAVDGYAAGAYIDAESRKASLKLVAPRFTKVPGVPIAVLIGDAIHNLRSALDYLAADILRPFRVDPESSSFPIDRNRQSLVGKEHYRQIERHAPDIATIIADFIDARGGEFCGLNQLDRTDKHRLLITTQAVAKFVIQVIADDNDISTARADSYLLLSSGAMVAPNSPADIHNKRYPNSTALICFGKGEPFENEPVVPTLHQLAQLVTGVVQTLETHLQRRPPIG